MRKLTTTIILLLAVTLTNAQPGTFSNISAIQRTDGSALVDINFDLSGIGSATYYISLEVSFNDGANYWPISAAAITGDIEISPGTGNLIIWDALQSHPNRFSENSRIKLVAIPAAILNPCPGTPTVTDIDGNIYNTVQIGNQCWMKENLRTTRYRNGIGIHPQFKWYNNDISYKYIYGALYDGAAALSGHGLCPEGWHVPLRGEWQTLLNYAGAAPAHYLKSCRQDGSPLGGDCDTDVHPRWDSHATLYGKDDFGFSALPGGVWSISNNPFSQLGSHGYWWTSTTFSTVATYYQSIRHDSDYVTDSYFSNSNFSSVRCIKTP